MQSTALILKYTNNFFRSIYFRHAFRDMRKTMPSITEILSPYHTPKNEYSGQYGSYCPFFACRVLCRPSCGAVLPFRAGCLCHARLGERLDRTRPDAGWAATWRRRLRMDFGQRPHAGSCPSVCFLEFSCLVFKKQTQIKNHMPPRTFLLRGFFAQHAGLPFIINNNINRL